MRSKAVRKQSFIGEYSSRLFYPHNGVKHNECYIIIPFQYFYKYVIMNIQGIETEFQSKETN
jgi:hypothetical protein